MRFAGLAASYGAVCGLGRRTAVCGAALAPKPV